MSPELEALLNDADRRFLGRSTSAHPAPISTSRLSPEEELDAVLPPDILAALEEGLSQDEEDDTSNPDLSTRERSETGSKGGQGSTTRAGLTEHGSRTSHTGPGDEDTGVGRPGQRSWAARPGIGSSPPISLRDRSLSQANAIVPSSPASIPYTTHSIPVQAPDSTVPPRTRAEPRLMQPSTPPPDREDDLSSEPPTPRSVRARSPSLTPLDGYSMEDQRREELSTAPPRAPSHSLSIDGIPSPRTGAGGGVEISRATDSPATAVPLLPVELEPQRTAKPLARISLTPIPMAPLLAQENVRGKEGRPTTDLGTGTDATPEPLGTSPVQPAAARPSIPATLVAGDVIRALAKCISSRFSGALVVEDDEGIRRVVLREGDFVTVASGVEGESLVSFLVQRGDLTRDALRLERKLPQFGRHAGAALIAHGYLRQDELWPVLRAHAEWILGRTLQVTRAAASLEEELPPRLQSEPTVFGGSTGAETLIEIVSGKVIETLLDLRTPPCTDAPRVENSNRPISRATLVGY